MWHDLRYALRLLAKSPGFTAVAVLTVALGIGPNTAVFSMVNAVLLRPLPFPNSDRLAMLWETWPARGFDQLPVDGPAFLEWKRSSHSFDDMAPAFTIPEYGFNLTAGGEPERAQAAQAAANFFDVMGVKPVIGRVFLPEEDQPGGRHVALLSYAFWQRRFGSDPHIIGRAIGLDGISHTVVGVLPDGIDGLVKVDLWVPVARDLAADSRGNHNFGIMARLKRGVAPAQAQKEMDLIARRLEQEHPDSSSGIGAAVLPLNELLAGRLRPALLVLLGAVGLLLLIACANVASLLLARGSAHHKEIAIRTAIGAGRARIVRQVLSESVLLAAVGGVLGLALAFWCVGAARRFVPDLLARLQQMDIDFRVLGFTFAATVLTGVLFGIAPALRAARTDLHATLKESGGRGSTSSGGLRLRSTLLTAEIAFSLVLLAAAGLLARSFQRVTAIDPGFNPDKVLTMHLALADSKYGERQKRTSLSRSILERVGSLPGVRSAAIINVLPLRAHILNLRVSTQGFHVVGQPDPPRGMEPTADYRAITPGLLRTLGIALRAGRAFDAHDTRETKQVALINESLARRHFPGQNPVGRGIVSGNPMEIVGVVADVRLNGLEQIVEPAIYVPYEQHPGQLFSLVVHTAGPPESLTGSVRRAIFSLDSEQAVADVRSLKDVMYDSLTVRRLSTWMMSIFALLALALAAVGIYGLVSYSVTQRTQEIGLRVALGAGAADVFRMVTRRSVAIALFGVALGLPAAFFASRLLAGLLYGVGAADPAVFLLVPLILLGIAALASYLPARRALRIEPTTALRYE
ncbi:MAG TPA: ABC transporter permease [Candidatus Sulfopaludibacter sp.]|nr:ABC transporter permease [Candidatus Sulfopaludibacter sp.]